MLTPHPRTDCPSDPPHRGPCLLAAGPTHLHKLLHGKTQIKTSSREFTKELQQGLEGPRVLVHCRSSAAIQQRPTGMNAISEPALWVSPVLRGWISQTQCLVSYRMNHTATPHMWFPCCYDFIHMCTIIDFFSESKSSSSNETLSAHWVFKKVG